jgi:hypothetical protein
LSAEEVQLFFDRWQAALPSPLTAQDRARGYRHELAFRQAEISDTRMFDRPAAGRAWFERTLPSSSSAALTRYRSCSAAASPNRRRGGFTTGHQPGREAGDPGSLPRFEGQAVLQRGACAQNRNDRQRYPRLRHRATTDPAGSRAIGGALRLIAEPPEIGRSGEPDEHGGRAPKPHVDDVAPAGEDECSGNRGA